MTIFIQKLKHISLFNSDFIEKYKDDFIKINIKRSTNLEITTI